ncbi:MAG: hypothetical protein NC217_07265 [Muribaculaceae bacterium]|nr:hypothetical protein [Muribaculaceae bacterium]
MRHTHDEAAEHEEECDGTLAGLVKILIEGKWHMTQENQDRKKASKYLKAFDGGVLICDFSLHIWAADDVK